MLACWVGERMDVGAYAKNKFIDKYEIVLAR